MLMFIFNNEKTGGKKFQVIPGEKKSLQLLRGAPRGHSGQQAASLLILTVVLTQTLQMGPGLPPHPPRVPGLRD